MPRLFPSMAAWVTIAATVTILIKAPSPVVSAALLVLPMIASALTVLSGGAAASRRIVRIGWWTVTLGAWAFLSLLVIGRWEAVRLRDEQQQIMLGAACAVAVAAWLMVRLRAVPTLRALLDIGAAAAVIALGTGGAIAYQEYQARRLAAEVQARWAAIGHPMDMFEKTLSPREGNAALTAFGEVMLQQVNASLYKASDRDAGTPRPTPAVPDEVIAILDRTLPLADVIEPDEKATPVLDARAEELAAAYARILGHEPPVWAMNPAETYRMKVPNYLGLRMFAQLIAADATRRFERGDLEGAKLALAAGRRANDALSENSILVSVMIRIAIDALLAPCEARLPATPGTLEAVAVDATRLKAALIRALQLEAWALLRGGDPNAARGGEIKLDLPAWARRQLSSYNFRRDLCLSALVIAEQVAILEDPKFTGQPDLAGEALDKVSERIPCTFAVNATRAAFRLNAMLLLREQSALLRLAREQVTSGQSLEPRESIVLPGRRWHFQADPATHTVALKLDSIPQYIVNQTVTNRRFWILPLDGSKPWQFRGPGRAAQR